MGQRVVIVIVYNREKIDVTSMIINRIQISDIGMLYSGERQIKTIYLNSYKSQKIFSMAKFL